MAIRKCLSSISPILLFLTLNINLAFGHVSLVTLPQRENVQITIYNSADITLVKEKRNLTLKKGFNKLEFSWANTLIDPTSIIFKSDSEGVELIDLSFLPSVKQSAIWNITAKESKAYPIEVSFFTSGISWQSFYIGTLSKDESFLNLKGYVKVTNNSGEDYENAQTRLIVGKIHILDEIAELARRMEPYGRPSHGQLYGFTHYDERAWLYEAKKRTAYKEIQEAGAVVKECRKKIIKEGLSEYFLYTIEGTETIKNKWTKRLLSFSQEKIPVENLIKYDEYQYGILPIRFLSFKNDKKHQLGETPLPGGVIKIFQNFEDKNSLKYIGEDYSKYIPVGEKVELKLGIAQGIIVKPVKMKIKSENYHFDHYGDISGWDEVQDWKITVKNLRKFPSKLKIIRHLNHQYFKVENKNMNFTKKDLKTIEFDLTLQPGEIREITYTIRYFEGTNREN